MKNSICTKVEHTIIYGNNLAGTALNSFPVDMIIPSLADIIPYAPRADRADFQAWTQADTCPQQRIGY